MTLGSFKGWSLLKFTDSSQIIGLVMIFTSEVKFLFYVLLGNFYFSLGFQIFTVTAIKSSLSTRPFSFSFLVRTPVFLARCCPNKRLHLLARLLVRIIVGQVFEIWGKATYLRSGGWGSSSHPLFKMTWTQIPCTRMGEQNVCCRRHCRAIIATPAYLLQDFFFFSWWKIISFHFGVCVF